MSARRGAAGLGAATVLALTAGCGMLGIGGEKDEASEEERLVEMLNESSRIEAELSAAEWRVVQNCLEEAGFTVHEPWMTESYEPEEVDSLTYGYPHESFILDAEEAATYGFGGWANAPEGWESSEAEDYYAFQEEKYAEEEGESYEESEVDTSAWDALTPEEQYGWYVAYQGAEYAEYANGTEQEYVEMMAGEEEMEGLSDEELAALEEEAAAEEEDEGEIVVEESTEDEEPMPGGCQLEMIEALYGEPTLVEETYEGEDGKEESWSYWTSGPENPAYTSETMYEDIEAEYAAEMSDLQGKFIDCVTAAGYEGWEFTEYNGMPTWEFFDQLYYQNTSEEDRDMMMGTDSSVEVPPLPEDAGDTFEEWKAYEIQMAVDFSTCGEEVGFVEPSEKAYDEANTKAYAAIEEDVYAWQEEMNDALSKAQELLDA